MLEKWFDLLLNSFNERVLGQLGNILKLTVLFLVKERWVLCVQVLGEELAELHRAIMEAPMGKIASRQAHVILYGAIDIVSAC